MSVICSSLASIFTSSIGAIRSRADRWLTLDDYIDGYLVDCIAAIRERHGIDKVSLLGICEGGVFTTCYAALHPETVKSMVITITPIDFHGDTVENRLGHGFINLWTRSLTPEDIDRLIEAYGNLPGRVHGVGVLADDPHAHTDEIQSRSPGSRGRREEVLSTSCAWRSGSPTVRTIRARPPSSG